MRSIRWHSSIAIFALASVVLFNLPTSAQTYNLGRTPTADELKLWNIMLDTSGKELPPGSGTVKRGGEIFAQLCSLCHGPDGTGGVGREGRDGPRLVGAKGTTQGIRGWRNPVSVWNFIKRAMPPVPPETSMKQGGALSVDDAYAVTAFLFFKNGLVEENVTLDAQTLAKVAMPTGGEEDRPHLREYPAVPAK